MPFIPAAVTTAHKKKRSSHILMAWLVLILAALSCNLPTANNEPAPSVKPALVQNYQPAIHAENIPEFSLTMAQENQLASLGYPDRFTILFFNETLLDGTTAAIRQEHWYYDSQGLEIVFRNGEIFSESQGAPVLAVDLGQTAYRPEIFLAGMSIDQLMAATKETGYYQEPADHPFIDNGTLVFMQGLAAGFEGDSLVYVEALPLGAAGNPANHPQAAVGPTAPTALPPEPTNIPTGGGTVIIEANKTGDWEIYTIDYDSGIVENLTNHPAKDSEPSCSPDGSTIAFSSDRTGSQEVFLMSPNGENLRQLTNTGTAFKEPIYWLSDHELLYWDGSPENSGWFTVKISDGQPVPISLEQGDKLSPKTYPAPDGSAELDNLKIADADYDIIIIDSSGTTNLTNLPGVYDWFPVWSPDSQKIMFVSERDGDPELYIMDRTGNILEQFTENTWSDYAGCWLP